MNEQGTERRYINPSVFAIFFIAKAFEISLSQSNLTLSKCSSPTPSLAITVLAAATQGMGARAASRASGSTRRGAQNRRRPSMDFVVDVKDALQDEKLGVREENPDDFLQDGSKRWQSGDPHHFSVPRKGDPWEESFKQVQKFDEEMCRGWREEIDTLLVFVGLFSAAVTAFTVESYRWLRAEPEELASAQVLALIAAQLNATGIPPVVESFSPDASDVRVNIFWFTSLTLSLTAVLVGILCKQWLREYQRYEGLSPKEAFPVRQMRYEGLLKWHVPKILSFLPLLLQSALLIFFAGLLDLLWSLHPLLASIISTLVGLVMILLASTTILPFAQYLLHFARLSPTDEPQGQCAFKSPQSRAFHLLGTSLLSFYNQLQLSIFGITAEDYMRMPSWDSDANWVNYDLEWQNRGKYMERGVAWFEKTYGRNVESAFHVFHCLETLNEDVAAGCVSQIICDTWDFLMPLTELFLPCLESVENIPQTEGRERRLGRDLVGMCYSFMHWRSDMCFGERCMELCARIANFDSGAPYPANETKGYASLVLEVLKIVVPSKDAATSLPDALHLQVVAILKSIFKEDRVDIDASDIPTFWIIFDRLRQHQYHGFDLSGQNSRWLAYDLLQEAELWLSRVMDSTTISVHDKERVVKDFSNGLVVVYRTARSNLEVDTLKSAAFYGTLSGFVKFIDRLLQSFMDASLILYPWDLDDWEVVKLEFGSVESVDTEATAKAAE
ncbi:hypothetical protein NMY22_g16999 [Coprinellus aureogranulatus]|nr:hypothetical protein NMY22_g16999 [Coprinellus aureogranulatus]